MPTPCNANRCSLKWRQSFLLLLLSLTQKQQSSPFTAMLSSSAYAMLRGSSPPSLKPSGPNHLHETCYQVTEEILGSNRFLSSHMKNVLSPSASVGHCVGSLSLGSILISVTHVSSLPIKACLPVMFHMFERESQP